MVLPAVPRPRLPRHPPGPEIAFIHLHRAAEERGSLRLLGQATADFQEDAREAVPGHAQKLGSAIRRQTKGKYFINRLILCALIFARL